jgi:hypothetical protein
MNDLEFLRPAIMAKEFSADSQTMYDLFAAARNLKNRIEDLLREDPN